MIKQNKEKMYECYEEIVDWFDSARTKTLMESEYLNLIINSVSAGGSVLDLGCGAGEQRFPLRGKNRDSPLRTPHRDMLAGTAGWRTYRSFF